MIIPLPAILSLPCVLRVRISKHHANNIMLQYNEMIIPLLAILSLPCVLRVRI